MSVSAVLHSVAAYPQAGEQDFVELLVIAARYSGKAFVRGSLGVGRTRHELV